MMKKLSIPTLLLATLLASGILASCKKDKDTPVPTVEQPEKDPMTGSWTGMYGSGNNEPNKFFAVNILEGGKLEIKDKVDQVNGSGTWKLEDGIFSAKYMYADNQVVSYCLEAKYNEEKMQLQGSWGTGDIANDGSFYLEQE